MIRRGVRSEEDWFVLYTVAAAITYLGLLGWILHETVVCIRQQQMDCEIPFLLTLSVGWLAALLWPLTWTGVILWMLANWWAR